MRARSMAMSLYADSQNVGDRLNAVWAHEHQDTFEDVMHPPVGPWTKEALELPKKLEAMADRLHELGHAAEPAQKVIFHVRRAREYVTQLDGLSLIFNKKEFYDHLWSATGEITGVLNRIDSMFEDSA